MIGFFRRIRKKLADDNQFLKYSRYAIGEIVLVVIGILIALSINNWNEQKKLLSNEHALYKKLGLDFKNETGRLKREIRFHKNHQGVNYAISNKTKGKFNSDSIISYNYLQFTVTYRPKIIEIYEETLNEISNENIRNLMRKYRDGGITTISAIEEYNDYKTGFVRPFVERNGLYNFDNVFDDDPDHYRQAYRAQLINSDKLEEHFNSDEFKSIIVALQLHLSWLIEQWQRLDAVNNEIIMALENEIKKE